MSDATNRSDQTTVAIARCPEHGLHGSRTECFVCGGPVEQVKLIDPAPFIAEHAMDHQAVTAKLAEWIAAGARVEELPAEAVHYVLACYGFETAHAGTAELVDATTEACTECGGDGYHQDDSHPANPTFTCEPCKGHGRVPKPTEALLSVEQAARRLDALFGQAQDLGRLDEHPDNPWLLDGARVPDAVADALLSLHDYLNDVARAREEGDA